MIKSNYRYNLDLFIKNITFKKQYIKNLEKQITILKNGKSKELKCLNVTLPKKKEVNLKKHSFVFYILSVHFSKSNTLVHLTDFSGKSEKFWSAGNVNYKGKKKKSRFLVFHELYNKFVKNIKIIKSKPIALHFKNVGSHKYWLLRKLKRKFFIRIVKFFDLYPHNGCRKKKAKRKKLRKKRRNGRVVRRQTVNLLRFSQRRFKPYFLQNLEI